jgi:hypothetical protein
MIHFCFWNIIGLFSFNLLFLFEGWPQVMMQGQLQKSYSFFLASKKSRPRLQPDRGAVLSDENEAEQRLGPDSMRATVGL